MTALGLALIAVWYLADLASAHRGPFASQFAEPPSLTASGFDPTYEFQQLATANPPANLDRLGRDAPKSGELLQDTLTNGFLRGGDPAYWVLIATAAATLAVALALRRWEIVRYLLAAAVFVGLMVALSALTQLGWHTYVPRRTGFTRFLQFWWFVPLAAVAFVPRLLPQTWYRLTSTVVLLAVACALWISTIDPTTDLRKNQPSDRTLTQLRALHLENKATVLSNAFTQDFVAYNTDALGLTDGRAPYLERDLLRRANEILLATEAFFRDPVGHPFPWDRYRVTYVLVSTVPNALGNSAIYPASPDALARVPDLVRQASGDGWILYRVQRAAG
jgi:hypothetical protein